MKKKLATGIFLYLFSIAIICGLVPWIVVDNFISSFLFYFRLVLLFGTCCLLGYSLHFIVHFITNKYLSAVVALFGCLFIAVHFAEAVYMFKARTFDAFDSLTSNNWYLNYWKPTDDFGFRGNQIQDDSTKKNIVLLGDSFAAGAGIENYKDRFSNILGGLVSKGKYNVVNRAVLGADTLQEFKVLMEISIKPDILIVSHFDNDIVGVGTPPMYQGMYKTTVAERLLLVFGQYSFFIGDFIAGLRSQELFEQYADKDDNYILRYLDKDLSQNHYLNISRFISYARSNKIPVVFVVFPVLQYGMKLSYHISTIRVEKFLKSQKVPVLSVFNYVKKIPYAERVVSAVDSHPSVLVNKIVGTELYNLLKREKILKQ